MEAWNEILMEIEDEILEATDSLRSFLNGFLRGRKWENYTFTYTEIQKDILREKMLRAFHKMKFQPPKGYDDE